MTKAVTAIYRTTSAADLVRTDLQAVGIETRDIKIVPRQDAMTVATRDDDPQWNDDLHALNVPEDDLRTYQQAVRNGDVVVSVELDEDADIAKVKEIMRHPERDAYDQAALDTIYEGASYTPRRDVEGYTADERYAGTRDPLEVGDDGRIRAYTRPNRYRYEAAGHDGLKKVG